VTLPVLVLFLIVLLCADLASSILLFSCSLTNAIRRSSSGVLTLSVLSLCPCRFILFLCLSCSRICSCCRVMVYFLKSSGNMKLLHFIKLHPIYSLCDERCSSMQEYGLRAIPSLLSTWYNGILHLRHFHCVLIVLGVYWRQMKQLCCLTLILHLLFPVFLG